LLNERRYRHLVCVLGLGAIHRRKSFQQVSPYTISEHTAASAPNGFGDLRHRSSGTWAVETLQAANRGWVHVPKFYECLLQHHHARSRGPWAKGSFDRQQLPAFCRAFLGTRTNDLEVAVAHSDSLGWCGCSGKQHHLVATFLRIKTITQSTPAIEACGRERVQFHYIAFGGRSDCPSAANGRANAGSHDLSKASGML